MSGWRSNGRLGLRCCLMGWLSVESSADRRSWPARVTAASTVVRVLGRSGQKVRFSEVWTGLQQIHALDHFLLPLQKSKGSTMLGKLLKDSAVRRGGQTSRYSEFETNNIRIHASDGSKAILVTFSIASKGGGVTVVDVTIRSEDFQLLIESMVEADRQSTMNAISMELAKQIGKQPIHDRALIAEGRTSVRREAESELRMAPTEKKTAARLALETVNTLIRHIENESQAAEDVPKMKSSPRAAP